MSARRLPALLRALRHRNYRLFILGQGTSQIGTWLSKFATSWMAYTLTGSPFMLGLVTFFNNAPTPIIAPFAGVFVDRMNRHKVVVITQILALLQSAALAAFATAAAAQDLVGNAAAGKEKASMCIGCHAIPGYRTAYPKVYHVPKIGGQQQAYIIAALKEYKSGARWHPSMLFARGSQAEAIDPSVTSPLCAANAARTSSFSRAGTPK